MCFKVVVFIIKLYKILAQNLFFLRKIARLHKQICGSCGELNSPATNWQHCKIMLARVISSNFWDKNVPIDERQCRHNV